MPLKSRKIAERGASKTASFPRRLLLALIVFATIIGLVPIFTYIEISDLRGGNILARFHVPPFRETFFSGYTHSVNLTPVVDVLRMKGDRLILSETWFTTYGVGMPDVEPGQTLVRTDEFIMISGINRDLGDSIVTVASAKTGNYISFEYPPRVAYYLRDYAIDATPVTIKIKRVSAMYFLWKAAE